MATRKDKSAEKASAGTGKSVRASRPDAAEAKPQRTPKGASKSEPEEPEVVEAELEIDDKVSPTEDSNEAETDADFIEPDLVEVEPDEPIDVGDVTDLDVGDDIDVLDSDLGELERPAKRNLPATSPGRLPEALSALNVYLARLKTVKILPIEEQAQLAAEYQRSGNKDAAARLVESNLRLVVKIAFQFRRQWADVMDLIAEGNLGLAEAIRKFDAERGIPFPSYARFWIRARILAFIQENKHLIHAGSRAARKLFWRLERERRQLINEGTDPEPRLLAERVGVSETDIRELAPILDQRPVSLDVPVHGDEDGRSRGEVMADPGSTDPEAEVGGEEIQDTLKRVFAEYRETLDERERAIWDLRLQNEEPVRLEDLGEQFGVSKERVRQLEVRIKKRLKEFVQRRLGHDVIVEALH